MKYVLWVCAFGAFLLTLVGCFLVITNALKGLEFYEETILKDIIGVISAVVTLGCCYAAADFVGKSWYGENPDTVSKKESAIKWGVFAASFAVIHTIFRLHDALLSPLFPDIEKMYLAIKVAFFRINLHSFIQFFVMPFEVNDSNAFLSLRGVFFMALTLTATYLITAAIKKRSLVATVEEESKE